MIQEDLLRHLIAGTATDEEKRQLRRWYNSHASQDEFFLQFRKRWELLPEEMPEEVQMRIYERLNSCLEAEKRPKKAFLRVRSWWKIGIRAAVACVVMGLGWSNYRLYQSQSEESARQWMVAAEKGQRAVVMLPDSTKVWLNSDTKIHYPVDYGRKERKVALDGEAFFKVAPNRAQPFVVEANGMQVEALGTSFNIKAYGNDDKIVASLYTGLVEVGYGDHSLRLRPRESALVDLQTGALTQYEDDTIQDIAFWQKDEYVFNGESLEEIARIAERMYNTTILLMDESLKEERYVGTMRNNSLENFLDIINLTTPIAYANKGDTICIWRKR